MFNVLKIKKTCIGHTVNSAEKKTNGHKGFNEDRPQQLNRKIFLAVLTLSMTNRGLPLKRPLTCCCY